MGKMVDILISNQVLGARWLFDICGVNEGLDEQVEE